MSKEPARQYGMVISTVLETMLAMPASIEALKTEIVELRRQITVLQAVQPLAIVSVPEAAERLGVTQPTVRRMIKERRLKSVRVGNRVRVDLSSVQSALLMTVDNVFGVEVKTGTG